MECWCMCSTRWEWNITWWLIIPLGLQWLEPPQSSCHVRAVIARYAECLWIMPYSCSKINSCDIQFHVTFISIHWSHKVCIATIPCGYLPSLVVGVIDFDVQSLICFCRHIHHQWGDELSIRGAWKDGYMLIHIAYHIPWFWQVGLHLNTVDTWLLG